MVVLVVDDEDDLREAIADLLRRRGYSVFVAANGQAALTLLRGGQPLRPALILLDLAMPIMDGRQLLAVIRGDPAMSDIPVVVASAQPCADTASGESGLLRKPFELEELFATVDSYCRPGAPPR